MKVSSRFSLYSRVYAVTVMAGLFLTAANPTLAQQTGVAAGDGQQVVDSSGAAPGCDPSLLDSPYIPVDSWVYPAVFRLYSLGYVDTIFLGMRPYTRESLEHMLEEASTRIQNADPGPATDEAQGIYESLTHELQPDVTGPCGKHEGKARVESMYSVERGISGTPLRDSYHLGSTIINDYGRPYQAGFNDYSGASGYASAGRFLIYARGEVQAAPSGPGYSPGLAQVLADEDGTQYFFNSTCYQLGTGPTCVPVPLNQLATIPAGPIGSTAEGRLMEAYVSAHYLNHEISFGKQDDWLGPGLGGGMAYSNNAENIYSFRINRIEGLHIPLLSYFLGPFRYEFLVGSLKGHVYPNDPWFHSEKISFRPTENLEFGFQRSVIWGGKGHEPITLHTFLRSFFSLSAPTTIAVKDSAQDPGARFGSFDFSYRLPLMRKWLTFYTDSEAHDEVSPADAPRRSSYRPGLYLSHVPGIAKLDVRAEAVNTDPSTHDSQGGHFEYYETIQRQGYTNEGVLMGDWIGREDKGGQGWITYHLSGDEFVQVGVRAQKATKDFIPGGTTLNDINFQVVKRLGKDFEINGNFISERWRAPIYPTGTPTYPATTQNVTATTIQLTWYPKNKVSF
jgi:Capsule assembly protein Wzi